jgi:hypothetical protein
MFLHLESTLYMVAWTPLCPFTVKVCFPFVCGMATLFKKNGLFFASEMSISIEALHFYFRKGGYSEMSFYSQISPLPSILIVHLQIKVT